MRIADPRAQQAVLAYRQTVLGAFHDVDNALMACAQTQRQAKEQPSQVADAACSRALADEHGCNGLAAYIEVLDAARRVHEAQIALSKSKVAAATHPVAPFKVPGRGWIDAQDVAATPPAIQQAAQRRSLTRWRRQRPPRSTCR